MKQIIMLAFLLMLTLMVGCSDNSSTTAVSDYSDQIAFVDKSFVQLKALNWENYSALMHPETLDRFQNMIKPGIEKLIVSTPSDTIMVLGKPYQAAEIQNQTSSEFFVTMMKLLESLSPEFGATYSTIQNKTIGAVAEGDTLVHVVSKTVLNFGGRPVEEMNVQSVRLFDGQWRLEPSNKIEGIAMVIRQGLPQ